MSSQRPDGQSTTTASVGVVGLGAMGSGLARRLLDARLEVHGTNRTAARAETLRGQGLRWHDTPRAVASATDIVISMVTDDAALREITSGPEGIVAGLGPGTVYVDMSSVSPYASLEVAEHVRLAGARMLDAPVSGSVPQVDEGTLTIMVGGDEATFRQVEPVLRLLGQSVTRVGDHSAGTVLKLAVNISLAVQALAFSEGLLLAERGGIDHRLAVDVMSNSAIGSPMLKTRAPFFLDLPETAWFPVALMRKDVRLALDEGHRTGVTLPTATAVGQVLETASELGYAQRDIAGLYPALAKISDRTYRRSVSARH
jgi:3-hydroxyisobutyrate dehydrogenase-like beta-hydroxyacid dehydrogenase